MNPNVMARMMVFNTWVIALTTSHIVIKDDAVDENTEGDHGSVDISQQKMKVPLLGNRSTGGDHKSILYHQSRTSYEG